MHARTHTHTRKTHLPNMTIVVALSQVIPLSDFNVALGYDLSRPEQVLATHPRSRWPARTHRRTRTYTHTNRVFPPLQQMFRCVHMCHTDTSVCVRVYISCVQKCFSAVQWQVQHEEIGLAHKHTVCSTKHARVHAHKIRNTLIGRLTNNMFLYLQGLP